MVMDGLIWIGIALCLSQSATLSGLNLACFRVSRLRLELEASQGDGPAARVLELRKDDNFLLVTILWGNVMVNVGVALLADSVMAGLTAFFFSTAVITLLAEIVPQASFSRHPLKVASALAPVLRIYQVLLYPVAKPTALALDRWLGREGILYFEEEDLRDLLRMHVHSSRTEIGRMEGVGALNFLDLDDLPLATEGEPVDARSVVEVEFQGDRPAFPSLTPTASNEFLRRIHESEKTWIVLVDREGEARMVLNSDAFLRNALFSPESFVPNAHCHRPVIVRDGRTPLAEVVPRLRVEASHSQDDVIEEDILLLWGEERRIITGSDILGRLLRGVVRREERPEAGT